ncbi:MAG: hypothetical protein F6K06_31645 [Okeania sp. SIO1H4]|nr:MULTISPECIES: hypothetical protein [Okeania]NES80014.1 hypothetical protein [Okeania sp. SIO1H4]NES91591.1 hypothetical protein [Okeania sp. SIO2B9]NET77586.1 hypothetical protein [Okeania sp. SIO1F9]
MTNNLLSASYHNILSETLIIMLLGFKTELCPIEEGDRRQETGGKLHGDSLPQVMREHPR